MNDPNDPEAGGNHPTAPESDASAAPGRWCVMRADDNGNDFVMRQDLDRATAAALAEAYERRGHKQVYWIRRQ